MPLAQGSRIGPYEILSPLGAGGMGEVYRARDTKLGRDVAIKSLPVAFLHDPERVARLQREAQLLASLNHPHIAAIYGLEEADGAHLLVLELVDGQTLDDLLKRGPLPLNEALTIAGQVAEALEAAHEKGIIHRDLKPANIALTHDGEVKVLDFGLAKAIDPGESGEPAGASMSPTISLAATRAGMILGTAAYMSPEQARGRVADKRTDVWAFGCVLFEMLSGRRAFEGEDVTDIIAAVLRAEPNWSVLPATVPEHIRLLVKRCLEKDRRTRISDIGVARFLMTEMPAIAAASQAASSAPPAPAAGTRRTMAWAAVALIAGIAFSAGVMWLLRASPPAPPDVVRFSIAPQGRPVLVQGNDRDLTISQDGKWIAYLLGPVTQSELVVRNLSELGTKSLATGNSLRNPFFSADGRWVGYFAPDGLRKVSIDGGPSTLICPAATPRGATWGADDTIYFSTSDSTTGILSVSGGGGEPKAVSTPDKAQGEVDHFYPSLLPDGQSVLLTVTFAAATSAATGSRIDVLDLKSGSRKIVVAGGSQAQYLETGHVVYAVGGSLRAVGFDARTLAATSPPVQLVEQLMMFNTGAAEFALSRQGSLLMINGMPQTSAEPRMLVWVDRQGREEPIQAAPVRTYTVPRISPDGLRAAIDIRDKENDIWIWDFRRQTLTPLTFSPAADVNPVWTFDNTRIVWSSVSDLGTPNIYWQSSNGTGTPERLTTTGNVQFPVSVTRDGKNVVVFEGTSGPLQMNISMLALPNAGEPPSKTPVVQPLVDTRAMEIGGEVSPNGRWLAYQSDKSGQFEIYVSPFPNTKSGGLWQVSPRGGSRPVWAPNGRELFYLDGKGLLTAVPVDPAAAAFTPGSPRALLTKAYVLGTSTRGLDLRSYDVSPDGQRFLMIKDASDGSRPAPAPVSMTVVLNWAEELKARVRPTP